MMSICFPSCSQLPKTGLARPCTATARSFCRGTLAPKQESGKWPCTSSSRFLVAQDDQVESIVTETVVGLLGGWCCLGQLRAPSCQTSDDHRYWGLPQMLRSESERQFSRWAVIFGQSVCGSWMLMACDLPLNNFGGSCSTRVLPHVCEH